MKPVALMLLAVLVLSATHAEAEVTVKEYKKIKAAGGDDWNALIVYIVGVELGISWSNAYLDLNHKSQMFCLPESLHTNAQFDIKILEAELQRHKHDSRFSEDTDKIEPALLYGFIHTYPCK